MESYTAGETSETEDDRPNGDDAVFETDDEAEYDDEEISSEEEDDVGDSIEETIQQYECVCEFKAEQEEDLSMAVGDVLTIIGKREDGWWQGENENGARGLVPSTFLKAKHANDESLTGESSPENQHPQANVIPRRSSLWQVLRSAVKKSPMLDILASLAIIPSTFRNSSLAILLSDDEHVYKFSNFITPTLSESQLSFRDVFWDPATDGLRSRSARIQKIISVVSARFIPSAGSGVETLSRHLRVCLYDGNKVFSDIHTIKAQSGIRESHQWDFNSKNFVSIEEGDFFLRSASMAAPLYLLMELCITYKSNNSHEEGELCCGWVKLPLLDESGIPVTSRSFRLKVLPGSPFEPIDGSDAVTSGIKRTGSLENLLQRRQQQPTLILKLRSPSSSLKSQMDFLPDELIGPVSWIPLLVLYRQIVTDALLRDRIRPNSCEVIHSPFLSNFSHCTDSPDLIDMLKTAWANRLKSAKRALKRDIQYLKRTFQHVFLETAFVICSMRDLPHFKLGSNLERKRLIDQVMNAKNVVALLLSDEVSQNPFDTREVTFDAFAVR